MFQNPLSKRNCKFTALKKFVRDCGSKLRTMFAGNFNARFRRETPISLGETSYSVQKRNLQSTAATHNSLLGFLGKMGISSTMSPSTFLTTKNSTTETQLHRRRITLLKFFYLLTMYCFRKETHAPFLMTIHFEGSMGKRGNDVSHVMRQVETKM